MSVTRGEARAVQQEGPSQSWWPAGELAWARVTPSDLVAADLAGDDDEVLERPVVWRLDAFDEERDEVTYELCLDSLGAQPMFVCRDAGAVVKFRDPVTFETGDDAQPLATWFAWLQRRDALMATEPRSDEWAGDDVDAQLERAEAHVVAIGEQAALLSVFYSVAAMREWAARLSPKPLAPLEIFAFDAPKWLDERRARSTATLMHEFHETSEDAAGQVVVKWIAMEQSAESAASWFATLEGRPSAAYVSAYSEGGGQVSAFAVERAIAWGEAVPFLSDEFDAGLPVAKRWVAVRGEGMPSGIAVPVEGPFVTWATDVDGASFVFRAEEAEASLQRLRAEQDFRLRWARWFNTDEPLTPEELAGGVAAVEATMKELA